MSDVAIPSIAFLGGGQMAEAFIRGLLGAGLLAPGSIWVSDVRPDRAAHLAEALGVRAAASNLAAVNAAEVAFVSVKPQDVPGLLDEVGADVRGDQVVLSIAAGVTIAALERRLPHRPAVIRAMPNAPALVQASMTVLAPGSRVGEREERIARRIFGSVGRAIVLPEKHLDAVTALSGSGPAYLAVVAEALADAGVRVGLPRDVAHLLAAQTMLGTGRLLVDTGQHPALLKDAVASPGGTSIAGLHALERGGVRALFLDAVWEATQQAAVLGQAATAEDR